MVVTVNGVLQNESQNIMLVIYSTVNFTTVCTCFLKKKCYTDMVHFALNFPSKLRHCGNIIKFGIVC